MKESKVLFYFTSLYPYGQGEQFLTSEIWSLAKWYDKIYLLPSKQHSASYDRLLPENVSVLSHHGTIEFHSDFGLKILKTYSKLLLSEFLRRRGWSNLFTIRYKLAEIKYSLYLAKFIQYTSNQRVENVSISFYSTWMDSWALALAILKYNGLINQFSFKMRGYDLFDERRKYGFMPYRNFIFSQATSAITVSKEGVSYLRDKGFKNVLCNYSGIQIMPRVPKPQIDRYSIVSCSNIIPLKRVDLIARSLKYIDFPVRWVHFGDGSDFDLVESLAHTLPKNVIVELRGNISNKEVLEFYQFNHVDLFIHVSLLEGFGFSIIEAFSFGIPAILYPGGAVKELIDERYCIGLSENCDEKCVS